MVFTLLVHMEVSLLILLIKPSLGQRLIFSVMTATGFQDICASNGQFACSNEKGTVVVSTNGIGWNQYQVLGSVPPYTRHINVLNDRFILSLDNGLSFKYSKITVNKVTFQTDKDLDKFNTGDLILKSPETRVLSVQANDSPPTMYVSSSGME